MQNEKPWHERDDFWKTASPFLFSKQRRAEALAEVENIVGLLRIEPGARVLDLCCGVGRHAVELASRGFRVTGVDRTPSYLRATARAAERESLQIELVHEDMRTFCRPDAFDATVNLFTSFGYFEDPQEDRRVAANVCRSLRPGGALVMELMGKEVLARVFMPRGWDEEDGFFVLRETRVRSDWSWVDNRWIMIKDGKYAEHTVSHRLYSAAELTELLTTVGFTGVDVYGDLAGKPYDQSAKRLVVVARK